MLYFGVFLNKGFGKPLHLFTRRWKTTLQTHCLCPSPARRDRGAHLPVLVPTSPVIRLMADTHLLVSAGPPMTQVKPPYGPPRTPRLF